MGLMSMPSGSSPEKADQYYLYLQGHHETEGRVATWHVDWLSLAWLWGFVIVISLALIWWIWQYRSTSQRIHPVDSWAGYTSELARPATRYFLLLSAFLAAFAIAIIIGHLVWGQKF
jgi:hypothetical protein